MGASLGRRPPAEILKRVIDHLMNKERVPTREQLLSAGADWRSRQRLGADDATGAGLDQRLEENVDLLGGNHAFKHPVPLWIGGRRCPFIRRPPPPPARTIDSQHKYPRKGLPRGV